MLNSLIEMFDVGYGTLTIHASDGAITRIEVNESVKSPDIAALLSHRSRP